MAQHRRKFSPQFRAEAAQFVIETGRPIAEIARELESGEGTLGNWVNEWKQGNPEPEKALTPVERGRGGRRDPQTAAGKRVPKKAAAFFARTQP